MEGPTSSSGEWNRSNMASSITVGMIVIAVCHEFIPSKHGMYYGYSLLHVEVNTEN
jgi:hypothetical protein